MSHQVTGPEGLAALRVSTTTTVEFDAWSLAKFVLIHDPSATTCPPLTRLGEQLAGSLRSIGRDHHLLENANGWAALEKKWEAEGINPNARLEEMRALIRHELDAALQRRKEREDNSPR